MPNTTVAGTTNVTGTGYIDTVSFKITVVDIAGNNTEDKGGGYNGQDTG